MDFKRLKTDLLALALLAATVFTALALFSYDPADPPSHLVYPERAAARNLCGPTGAVLAHHLYVACGAGAWFIAFCMAAVDGLLFARRLNDFGLRVLGAALMLYSLCVTLQWTVPGLGNSTALGSGGYFGAWGLSALSDHLTFTGACLVLAATGSVGTLLASDWMIFQSVIWFLTIPWKLFETRGPKKAAAVAPPVVEVPQPRKRESTKKEVVAKAASVPAELVVNAPIKAPPAPIPLVTEREVVAHVEPVRASKKVPEPVVEEPEEEPVVAPPREIRVNKPMTSASPRTKTQAVREPVEDQEFALPGLGILEDAEEFPYEFLAEKARIAAGILEKTFLEFGLNVKVVEIDTGPVVTQFELELEAGLRLNKVTALADDLAIALRVPSVRVVAPIPGKNTVGVEVPNEKQVMVRLRELIEACPDAQSKRIPIFLGKDVSGRPLVIDMAKMPHLLIAGRTGTGKSVCLNTLILSLLMSRTPDQVKLLMIDPKMVELSPYMRVPHLMHPVITDMKKAEAILGWAVEKMEERYDLLARCGVRHLDSYNDMSLEQKLDKLGLEPDSEEAEQVAQRMPYIVIIADEMADMMMTSGKEVETHIIRLAQKSRAVGIHLVLATQKPTVDVITGLIKSNLPARIAFQVASRTDSRVVLDEMGADKLLGNGDMLYLAPGGSRITRAQGTYVSDKEVNEVIEFYSQYEPQYSRELAQVGSKLSGKSGIEAIRARDELYEQAIEVIVREGRGSVSLLQRHLGIGYGRAARLIDYMAEDGIVGDYNGSQAREVLYTPEQWEDIVAGAEPADSLA